MGLTTPSRKTASEKQSLVVTGMIRMTDVLQGVDDPTVNSLKPKENTRIACWNVRTLYQTDKLAQVVREFHNYGLGSG